MISSITGFALRIGRVFEGRKALWLIPLLLSQWNCGASSDADDESQVDGYFVNASTINKDMRINPTVNLANFAAFIKRERPHAVALSAEVLAKKTDIVTKCFMIDPYMLMGLMKVESRYMPEAVSPTGATGLTQFTAIAFSEVHDQTGSRGPSHASAGVIQYFNSILNGCIKEKLTHESSIILWKHTSSTSVMKNKIMEKPELALIYAAILLKTYLANQSRGNQSLLTTYDLALRQYNGEPGDRKVRYARNVISAAKALGLNSRVSGSQTDSVDENPPDLQTPATTRPSQPTTRPTTRPTPTEPTHNTADRTQDSDPAAYDIILMYKDGMRDGRPELNRDVLDMQTRLKKLGYDVNPDGKYGDETAVEVSNFQRANDHIVDGFGFSAKDWKVLQEKTN
jgi:hypothetical protein